MDILTRYKTEDDRAFIFSSYLQSLRESYPLQKVPKSIYFPEQTKILEYLWETATILVACFPEDSRHILAYAIFERFNPETIILHYIYSSARSKGFARRLLESALNDRKLIIHTHITNQVQFIKNHLTNLHFTYDPYYLTNQRLIHETRK